MSTKRRTLGVHSSPTPKNEKGERLCRNCGKVLTKGQRHNCSPKCSLEWQCKTSPGILRQTIFNRDKGICVLCGVDVFEGQLQANGSPVRRRARGSGDLWQADHIVPVIEGGGECSLENIRTLCIPCHKKATKELAERMARRRREKKAVENDAAGLFADQLVPDNSTSPDS